MCVFMIYMYRNILHIICKPSLTMGWRVQPSPGTLCKCFREPLTRAPTLTNTLRVILSKFFRAE